MATEQQTSKPNWLTGLPGFWAMFTVGIASAIIGPSLPYLVQMYNIGWGEAGWMFSAQFGGKLAAVLLLSLWEWKTAAPWVAMVGSLLLGSGLLLTGISPGWVVTLAAVVVFGLGHGGVDASFNAIFAHTYSRGADGTARAGKWLNKLHLLFGIGALCGPLLVTFLGTVYPWKGPFIFTGWLALAIPVIYFLINRGRRPLRAESSTSLVTPIEAVAGTTVFWVVLAALVCFLYGGLETALGGWIFTFLTEGAFVTGPIAALSVTLFWAFLTVGRFISVWGVGRFGQLKWIWLLSIVLTVSLAAGLIGMRMGNPAVLIVLAGLGLSGIFPTVIAWVSTRKSSASAKTVAWLIASSSLGAISVPWMVGKLFDWQSLEVSFFGLLLLSVVLLGLVFWMIRKEQSLVKVEVAEG